MRLEINIALRYLFSKKKYNAINVISAISVSGIALATLTLVCTLSVFNGFQKSVASFFTAFDPELKVIPQIDKFFKVDSALSKQLNSFDFIEKYSYTLEENAMIKYKDRQNIVTLKGVDDNFHRVTNINTILIGSAAYQLKDKVVEYGILGAELANTLGTGVASVHPIEVYAPKKGKVNMANPTTSFNKNYLYLPGALFAVHQAKYDANYIICSIDFIRNIYGYRDLASAIELKLKPNSNLENAKKIIQTTLGDSFSVIDRYEQQTEVFNIMKIEKLISYLFLTFIVLIASFNIISSLSMLIIEKKGDMTILKNLGSTNQQISRIFLLEGQFITIIGTVIGLLLGIILVLIQEHFGIIKLGGGGQFITSSYPVNLQLGDLIVTLITVLTVGLLAVAYPIRYLSNKILS